MCTSASPCPLCPRPADALAQEILSHAIAGSPPVNGHHNRNYVVRLTPSMARRLGREPGSQVLVRVPRHPELPVVIRTWDRDHEGHVMGAARPLVERVPECLRQYKDLAIHAYVPGRALSEECGDGKPVDALLAREAVGILARTHQVKADALPDLPPGRSPAESGRDFLRALAHQAHRQIVRANWPEFGDLFTALGIPGDALVGFAERVPDLVPRPPGLLHMDLHRGNLLLPEDGGPALCLDWELSSYGDPLCDLAIHLVRMRYPEHQWEEVMGEWYEAMEERNPGAARGMIRDLPHHLAFERAQSVFPDVIRAARTLRTEAGAGDVEGARQRVLRAVRDAERPLRLAKLPDDRAVERALAPWLPSPGSKPAGGRPRWRGAGSRPATTAGGPLLGHVPGPVGVPAAESLAGVSAPACPCEAGRAPYSAGREGAPGPSRVPRPGAGLLGTRALL
ncbi:phosphotransferase, partial [Streptomyces sp. SID5910]|uniref:phosphotransferase n=1 Tax=Streptomyces sp. SID5910 TaxID=2690312 RepID=UPI001369CECD